MQYSTPLVTALAALFVAFCPTTSTPMPAIAKPAIEKQGRDFNSRFAPPARPVFPRSQWENITSSAPGPTGVVARAAPVVERGDYDDYPHPTASEGPGHHHHHHHPW